MSNEWNDLDGNGWPKSWGVASCFGRMGVIHSEPFPHYVGEDGCDCQKDKTVDS